MIRIKLIPQIDFAGYAEVRVMDFPDGETKPTRQRCKVRVDYGAADIAELCAQGITDIDSILQYYRDWVYNIVRINISQDWECAGGMDEVLEIVREHIAEGFKE